MSKAIRAYTNKTDVVVRCLSGNHFGLGYWAAVDYARAVKIPLKKDNKGMWRIY